MRESVWCVIVPILVSVLHLCRAHVYFQYLYRRVTLCIRISFLALKFISKLTALGVCRNSLYNNIIWLVIRWHTEIKHF